MKRERVALARHSALLRAALGSPAAGFAIMALSALAGVALLGVSAWLIVRASEMPPILYLQMAIVGVRGFAIGKAFFRYVGRLMTHNSAFRAVAEVRVDVFQRLMRLAPAGVTRLRGGEALSAIVRDVDTLQFYPLRVVEPLVTASIVVALALAGMLAVDVAAALVTLAIIVTSIAASIGIDSLVAAAAIREIAPLRARVAAAIRERSARLDVFTAFGVEGNAQHGIARLSRLLSRAETRRSWGRAASATIMVVAAGSTSVVMVLMLSGALVGTEFAVGTSAYTPAVFAVMVLGVLAVFDAVAQIPVAVASMREVRASARQIDELAPIDVPAEIPVETNDPVAIPDQPVSLRLDSVSARWPGDTSDRFDPVSVDLAVGDCLVITGESGAGKSTLAMVLARFLEYSGRYLVNGVEVSTASPRRVREIVGLCEQSPHIFDDTIRQNLLFARDTATDSDLWEVLERVGLAEWARDRGGLDTPLGERGSLVSGGEAQRIALARVLLAGHPIVVLDEPTANVDRSRADALIADILQATSERVVIIIAHDALDSARITHRIRITAR